MTSAMDASRRLAAAVALLLVASGSRAMSLGEALDAAVQHDPTIAATQATHAADRQLGEQERAALRPSLSAVANGNYTASDSKFAFGSARDEFPSWSAYLRARQALLRFDWSARGDRADALDAQADETLQDRRVRFVTRVAQRYVDTLLAEDSHAQAESEARAVRESLSDTRKRYDVDLVPGTDLKEAQARDDLAQAQLISAQSARDDARDALYEITHYDRKTLPRLRESLQYPPLNPVGMDAWIALARTHSTATRAAELQVRLATADLESRRAAGLPSADLVAEVGRNDSTEYLLGQRVDEARVGVELTVPLFAGGYNRSRTAEGELRLQAAEAELKRVTLETERAVRNAYRAVETARAEESAYDRALASATLAEAAARAGYDAGTRTITDVLDATSQVVQARRNRNAARYTVLSRLLELKATAGTLTKQDLYDLDALFDLRPSTEP